MPSIALPDYCDLFEVYILQQEHESGTGRPDDEWMETFTAVSTSEASDNLKSWADFCLATSQSCLKRRHNTNIAIQITQMNGTLII